MITFIKKIKTKEGINNIAIEKIMKEIPGGYIPTGKLEVTYTANHIVVAIACQEQEKKAKAPEKKSAKAKAPAKNSAKAQAPAKALAKTKK